jgi:hypothetical protein
MAKIDDMVEEMRSVIGDALADRHVDARRVFLAATDRYRALVTQYVSAGGRPDSADLEFLNSTLAEALEAKDGLHEVAVEIDRVITSLAGVKPHYPQSDRTTARTRRKLTNVEDVRQALIDLERKTQ